MVDVEMEDLPVQKTCTAVIVWSPTPSFSTPSFVSRVDVQTLRSYLSSLLLLTLKPSTNAALEERKSPSAPPSSLILNLKPVQGIICTAGKTSEEATSRIDTELLLTPLPPVLVAIGGYPSASQEAEPQLASNLALIPYKRIPTKAFNSRVDPFDSISFTVNPCAQVHLVMHPFRSSSSISYSAPTFPRTGSSPSSSLPPSSPPNRSYPFRPHFPLSSTSGQDHLHSTHDDPHVSTWPEDFREHQTQDYYQQRHVSSSTYAPPGLDNGNQWKSDRHPALHTASYGAPEADDGIIDFDWSDKPMQRSSSHAYSMPIADRRPVAPMTMSRSSPRISSSYAQTRTTPPSSPPKDDAAFSDPPDTVPFRAETDNDTSQQLRATERKAMKGAFLPPKRKRSLHDSDDSPPKKSIQDSDDAPEYDQWRVGKRPGHQGSHLRGKKTSESYTQDIAESAERILKKPFRPPTRIRLPSHGSLTSSSPGADDGSGNFSSSPNPSVAVSSSPPAGQTRSKARVSKPFRPPAFARSDAPSPTSIKEAKLSAAEAATIKRLEEELRILRHAVDIINNENAETLTEKRIQEWREAGRIVVERLFGMMDKPDEDLGAAGRRFSLYDAWASRGEGWGYGGSRAGVSYGWGSTEDNGAEGALVTPKHDETHAATWDMGSLMNRMGVNPDILGWDPEEDDWS